MACVYRHIRLDKNEVFYIGIGKNLNRSYTKYGRNSYWNNIINKTEYKIQIIFDDISWDEACKKEIELIKLYGRKDLGLGTLVNLNDGGGSNNNWRPTEVQLNKMSESHKNRKQTQEEIEKRKNTMKSKKIGCKKVINIETNEIYDSIIILSKILNIPYTTLANKLNGNKRNNTNFRLYNEK